MSIFGWSLPPGCSGTPFDDPCYCEVCGGDPESSREEHECVCPECPVCGEVGRPECYEEHGMVKTEEQIQRMKNVEDFLKKQSMEDPSGWEDAGWSD